MATLVRLDPWAYVAGAALLLLLPLDWLLAALVAGAVHEGCHVLAIRLLRGQVLGARVGAGGAVIDASLPGRGQELICALAGPAGSLALLALCRILPKLALCGLIQGLYNLLPVYPLDGGRALGCALEMVSPRGGAGTARRVEQGVLLLLVFLTMLCRWAFWWKVLVLAALCRGLLRKRPCKSRQIGVQ